ncbi:hypothetical protein [Pectinatus frisingensis]|uniref:hypothetical protein n=1 Tax=Pectinatus frisingensis TaxID=865 RepID=UPI0018C704C3|nr:hypothetical protein [Pectinatus frisingensis]
MDVEISETLEDEYMAQREVALHIHPVEIQAKNEKKRETEISALLIDISETLRLLSEQIGRLNEVTKTVPETVAALKKTTEAVQSIANELPAIVREQCLEEYKKILANAVKNYNQMQKAADKWQKSIDEKQVGIFKILTASAIITPILLLLNLLFK